MFKTRVTEMFGIKYPIICGGMLWVTQAELAAAVSNAGGLGVITSANLFNAEGLRKEILKLRELTDKPFAVNLSLNPTLRKTPNDEFVQVIVEEHVKIAEVSGARSPAEVIPALHAGEVKVMAKATTIRHALNGERSGADAMVILGIENGGNVGMEDVSTMVIVPKAVDVLKIPVIAAGGIADARGFVAALALGAEAVLMGTRFVATRESPAHPKYKDWILRTEEYQTTLAQRSIKNTHRTLINLAVQKTLELEARGASIGELAGWISGFSYRKGVLDGELNAGMAYCGQIAGIIHDIPTVKEVIDRMVDGAEEIQERLTRVGLFK